MLAVLCHMKLLEGIPSQLRLLEINHLPNHRQSVLAEVTSVSALLILDESVRTRGDWSRISRELNSSAVTSADVVAGRATVCSVGLRTKRRSAVHVGSNEQELMVVESVGTGLLRL